MFSLGFQKLNIKHLSNIILLSYKNFFSFSKIYFLYSLYVFIYYYFPYFSNKNQLSFQKPELHNPLFTFTSEEQNINMVCCM